MVKRRTRAVVKQALWGHGVSEKWNSTDSHYHHCAAVMSSGWAKVSAYCFHMCLSCANPLPDGTLPCFHVICHCWKYA